jgi:hypothetical protein
VSRRKSEPFEIVTYSGVDIDQLSADGERPPRSAKRVATVIWSWSPAHSRYESYLICADRKRTRWTLWAVVYDEGRRIYARFAFATPFRGYTAKFAAERLLAAAWKDEMKIWDTDLRGARVCRRRLADPNRHRENRA